MKVLRAKLFITVSLIFIISAIVGFTAAWLLGGFQSKDSQSLGCAVAVCVALQPDKANPDTITLKAGESAQFNSADNKSHQLSLGLGGEEHSHTGPYNSGEFKADEAWRVQFKEPGTYKFHDHFNPKINILVVVYKEGETPKI